VLKKGPFGNGLVSESVSLRVTNRLTLNWVHLRLKHAATRCNTLQHAASYCKILQHMFQCVAVRCSALQCVAVRCTRVAVWRSVVQCVVVRCRVVHCRERTPQPGCKKKAFFLHPGWVRTRKKVPPTKKQKHHNATYCTTHAHTHTRTRTERG